MLLNPSPDLRPTPDQLRSISFFQSAGALLSSKIFKNFEPLKNEFRKYFLTYWKTLHYLDTLLQRPQNEKEQFFQDLPAVLDQLPSRVRTGLVMNSLRPEFANTQILPTLLPSVFKVNNEKSSFLILQFFFRSSNFHLVRISLIKFYL